MKHNFLLIFEIIPAIKLQILHNAGAPKAGRQNCRNKVFNKTDMYIKLLLTSK